MRPEPRRDRGGILLSRSEVLRERLALAASILDQVLADRPPLPLRADITAAMTALRKAQGKLKARQEDRYGT
jgi:hypothetical protein